MPITAKEIKKIKPSFVVRKMIESAKELGIRVDLVSEKDKILIFEKGDKRKYFKNISSVYNTNVSAIIAANKNLTKTVLDKEGIKTVKGYLIKNIPDLKSLIKNKKLKFPIVIKPNELMEGVGVSVNINNIQDSIKAINNIKKIEDLRNETILVEDYFYGRDYRLFVSGNNVIAATERIHPSIKGDGKRTIKELIKKEIDRGRGKLKLDHEVRRSVKDAGYKISDVLERNKTMRIRHNANFSTGAIAKNVTKKVSPYFKRVAVRAVKALGLGIGGVDILAKDISLKSGDYIVIEINGCPNPDLHIKPNIGKSINVPMLIIRDMFKIK